jgi:DNA-directed RNA polymerase specialized sigma24 family protein
MLRAVKTGTALTDLEEASDEALVALARADRAAFGVLDDRYLSRVYRYGQWRLGDRERAEDATGRVFGRALAALSAQQGPLVRSWLFTIAQNVVLNSWGDDQPVRRGRHRVRDHQRRVGPPASAGF